MAPRSQDHLSSPYLLVIDTTIRMGSELRLASGRDHAVSARAAPRPRKQAKRAAADERHRRGLWNRIEIEREIEPRRSRRTNVEDRAGAGVRANGECVESGIQLPRRLTSRTFPVLLVKLKRSDCSGSPGDSTRWACYPAKPSASKAPSKSKTSGRSSSKTRRRSRSTAPVPEVRRPREPAEQAAGPWKNALAVRHCAFQCYGRQHR